MVNKNLSSFRTRQEEMRATERKMSSLNTEINSNIFDFSNTNTSNSTSNNFPFELTTENCIYIHGGLIAALFLFAIIRSIGFYSVCMRASQKLHDSTFNGLISTIMRFFDENPAGRILNRFSKDIGAVDELLPKAILDSSQVILSLFGSVILTSIVNPIFLIPVGVMGFVFTFVRRIFLKTSKEIKRLEGISK